MIFWMKLKCSAKLEREEMHWNLGRDYGKRISAVRKFNEILRDATN